MIILVDLTFRGRQKKSKVAISRKASIRFSLIGNHPYAGEAEG
jgi:hypothetical protein